MSRTIAWPKRNGPNPCAFCQYWNGDADIIPGGVFGVVELNRAANGMCIRTRSSRSAGAPSCRYFEMNYEASRNCR